MVCFVYHCDRRQRSDVEEASASVGPEPRGPAAMAMQQDIGRLGRIKAVAKMALNTGKATANEMEDLVGGNALREEARRMFDIADADGSGAINMQEFRGAYEAITHKSLPRNEVEEVFRLIDTSGDNSVSFEEFYEWVKKQRSVPLHLRKPRIVGFLESFFTPQDDSFKVAQREKQAVGELRAAAKDPRVNKTELLDLVIDNTGLELRDVMDFMEERKGANWKYESELVMLQKEAFLASLKAKEQARPVPRGPDFCAWRGEDEDGVRFVCNNKVLRARYPAPRRKLRYCGWHMPRCAALHADGSPPLLLAHRKNAQGMCIGHWLALVSKVRV